MTYEMPMKKNNARRNVMSGARAGMKSTASASLSRVPSGASARPMSYPRMQSTKNSVTRGRRDVPMHKSGTQKVAYAAGGALVALHDAAVHFARDTKKALLEVTPEPKIKTVRVKPKKQFPFSFLFTAAITTVLIMFIIMNYVMIHDYTKDISDLNDQIQELAQTEKDLSLELTKKEDILTIEKIAREELGMVQSDQVTRKYISLESGDKTEVLGDQSNDRNYPLFTAMSAIGNAVSDTFRYIK